MISRALRQDLLRQYTLEVFSPEPVAGFRFDGRFVHRGRQTLKIRVAEK